MACRDGDGGGNRTIEIGRQKEAGRIDVYFGTEIYIRSDEQFKMFVHH